METPSSTRRVTRSQTLASANNNNNNNNIPTMSKKIEESEKGVTKSKKRCGKQQQHRSALIDITNDSPIVGLAMESLEAPSSAMSKKRWNGRVKHGTPGSGEALLRSQVKTLLQKVEEEAELSKVSLENRPFLHLQGIVNSPVALLAPTPANTPQVLNLSANESFQINDLAFVTASPVEDKFVIFQMVTEISEGKKQDGVESEKDFVTRSLLLDFSEKLEEGCDSSDCEENKEKISNDDDDASIWSMQVNASSTKDDDEEEEEEEEEEEGLEEVEEECDDDYDYEEEEEEYGEGLLLEELCEGITNMNVNGVRRMAKFAGKHTRFVYNSDGELQGQEECVGESQCALHCCLSTPIGKHLRFHEEEEEEDED